MMSITPDAHSVPELDHMHWGVEMARKAGVPPNRILNAMTLPEITRSLQIFGVTPRFRRCDRRRTDDKSKQRCCKHGGVFGGGLHDRDALSSLAAFKNVAVSAFTCQRSKSSRCPRTKEF